MSIIWDPRTVLAIFREDGRFTCVGTTKKGLRCGNFMFSGADRSEALQILDTIALRHPSSQAVRNKLSDLARLTLCPRWHRKTEYCQETQMVQKWQRAIENYCNSITADVPATTLRVRPDVAARSVSSTAALTSDTVRVRRSPSPPSDAIVREIRAPRVRRRSTILTPQPTVISTPPTPTILPSPRAAASSTTIALPTPPVTPTRQHDLSATTTSPTSTNSPGNGQNNRTNAFLPLTPPCPTPSVSPPTPCPEPHRVRRKPITEDCAVCQEPICCPDDAVWCRAQCGQNTHRECFAEWRRQSLRQAREGRIYDGQVEADRLDAVRCVFCRAVWKWEWQD